MRNILVVGPSWVGDMVMAQSLFMALREAQPENSICVLAPGWSAPVLARMPEVASSIDMPVGHGSLQLGARYRVAKILRSRNFDQAIVIPGSLKSALIPWLARIPTRTGYVGEQRYGLLNDIRRLDKAALPLNVERYVALSRPRDARPETGFSHPRLQVEAKARDQALGKFDLDTARPVVGLCPGAEFGPAKRWPVRHFAAVANAMLDAGRQVWLFGSIKDVEIAEQIHTATKGRCVQLAGRTELGEAIDLMSVASTVVTNDSGLMHVAAAVGCHVIALYGSSSDEFTPPLTQTAERLSVEIDCRPCFQRKCPLHHLNCLKTLAPETVIQHLSRT